MSKKAIREYDGKRMFASYLEKKTGGIRPSWDRLALITPLTILDKITENHPWLRTETLVVKPDQLIKRRGKLGLVGLKMNIEQAQKWVTERREKPFTVGNVTGMLEYFLMETFCPHQQADEYYVCIQVKRDYDEILFYHEGGIDVGDVDEKALRMQVNPGEDINEQQVTQRLLQNVPEKRRPAVASFLTHLFHFCVDYHFSYLEINPIVVVENEHGVSEVIPLDMAAKIDETAKFLVGTQWGQIDFPAPFGRPLSAEEAYIAELDNKTGASVKLTVLNPHGRIWTMVAGGGASVIYADTICDLGGASELANYGEYSGAPDEELTYNYARTILSLMTKEKNPRGKILIIGGGIANFTNVAETFTGIVRALTQFSTTLIEHRISIYVRRGGPNYQEGLELMRNVARQEGLPIDVFGPETHMTAIVALALGVPISRSEPQLVPQAPEKARTLQDHVRRSSPSPTRHTRTSVAGGMSSTNPSPRTSVVAQKKPLNAEEKNVPVGPPKMEPFNLFTSQSRAIIFGMQPVAVQNMLDFDYICNRDIRSIAAVVYPFSGNHLQKFYWRTQEVLIPIFQEFSEAVRKYPEVDVVINFSSFRSVFETTVEIMQSPQIRTIAIIAEGVPERQTRLLICEAKKHNVKIVGPATVGGIKSGAFRIGNTGGALDNIIAARLYRPGSVAYVARSGGMSNELNNIVAQNSDGVYEGIAIGGDQYPGTTFIDHLLRYQDNPDVKIMVVLGEVGGVEEYEIVKLIKDKRLTKPIIAWCIGTCSKMFPYEVQFGHAGACAGGMVETADAKNEALRQAGAHVPSSFDDFGVVINRVYVELVKSGQIVVKDEPPTPSVPVDYSWARKLGLIRKPASFVSSIVDERGDELEYAGMKIGDVLQSNMGVGGVIGLIWFRRRLPDYFCRFIELVLMVTADHGPAVSGAHNTIVATRAGKDLISSLCSGLLTIGPRFGGALDGAAMKFSWGFDNGLSPSDFVDHMRRQKELIMGIGHKVKSLENPDMRVVIVKEFAKKHFKATQILDYALAVEQITTKKRSNLILNVDGAIACSFVDLLRSCDAFSLDEANEYIHMGSLNGLFVLGRTIGFIGHHLDQIRLKQPLYRHATEDINYVTSDLLV